MTLDLATAIFGWMTVINLAVYLVAAAFIVFARGWITHLQERLMGVPAERWPELYVDYLSRYKLAIMVFNVAPWLALTIVG
jgi:hypothetical protein